VHLRNDVVVVDGRHFLEKGGAVDVERSTIEREVGIPLLVISLGRDDVNGLGRVVEVSEIDVDVIRRHGLELGLSDEHLVLMLDDHLTLLGVEVHVRTVDLRSGSRDKRTRSTRTTAALDSELDLVELKRGERKRLGPIFGEEEGNEIMIGSHISSLGVIRNLVERHGTRRLSAILLVE